MSSSFDPSQKTNLQARRLRSSYEPSGDLGAGWLLDEDHESEGSLFIWLLRRGPCLSQGSQSSGRVFIRASLGEPFQ